MFNLFKKQIRPKVYALNCSYKDKKGAGYERIFCVAAYTLEEARAAGRKEIEEEGGEHIDWSDRMAIIDLEETANHFTEEAQNLEKLKK